MKKVSVAEIGRICAGRDFREFRLSSADQPQNGFELSLQYDLVFERAYFDTGPDLVCLKGTGGTVYFRHIQYVCVAPVRTALGMVFDVVCTDGSVSGYTVRHRILAVDR